MSGARRCVALGGWLAAGFTVALLATTLASLLLGQRAVVVLSGSMEPVFSPGDVLIERGLQASEVEIGQIVTFEEPGTDRQVTHRVRRIEARKGRLVFVTKGDADNSVQRWSIAAGGTLGQPTRAIPAIGHVAMLARTPLGLFGMVLLPLLVLAGLEIRAIWRADDRVEGIEAQGARS